MYVASTPRVTYSTINVLPHEAPIVCNSKVLSDLLLQQWKRLTKTEIEETRYVKRNVALLIERKYGIPSVLTENYLSNLERTLPQMM